MSGAGIAGAAILGTVVASSSVCGNLLGGDSDMNVIVIVIDSLRKDHVGAYGNSWIQTPNLDALSEESLRFTRAYPESLPTICARRAIHTGRRTWPFRDWKPVKSDLFQMPGWQPIPEDQTTLAEILAESGYETMFVTDTVHQFKPRYDMHRGFRPFHFVRGQERDFYRPLSGIAEEELDKVLRGGEIQQDATDIVRQHFANTRGRTSEEDWFAPQVFLTAMDYLTAAIKTDKPFLLLIDAYDPHEPWDPPERYINLYDDEDGPNLMSSKSGRSARLGEKKLKRMHALYSAEVTMVDHWLGNFIEKFHELNLGEDTLLLLLSDHGIAFGEHGFAGKVSEALYPELTDVPFLVRHPQGKKAGETTDYFASTHDIAPTVLGALGMDKPDPMDGHNLYALFEDDAVDARPYFTLGYKNHSWARDDRYALISGNNGGGAKLFDIVGDPDMNKDIAGANPDVVKRMFEDYIMKDAGGSLPEYG